MFLLALFLIGLCSFAAGAIVMITDRYYRDKAGVYVLIGMLLMLIAGLIDYWVF
jgi:hypothetical protein